MTSNGTALLEVRGAKKYYPVRRFGGLGGRIGEVKAVDGVNLKVEAGETYGLVGESGSGKTTVGKLVLRLEPPSEGEIIVDGRNVIGAKRGELASLTGVVQAVFQDPFSSLSPRMLVRDIIREPLTAQRRAPKGEMTARVLESLRQVGLPEGAATRYPHEFSGGQRQRVAIARAIASGPRLIVLDEPVSALDVSIRAQILNLLKDLQRQLGLSYLLIAHDLAIVEHMADRIGVMYLGRIVEEAPGRGIFRQPLHPYTHALLAAVPVPDPKRRRREFTAASGEIPSAMNIPQGCRFNTRCPFATEVCAVEDPQPRELAPAHFVACHHAEQFLARPTESSSVA